MLTMEKELRISRLNAFAESVRYILHYAEKKFKVEHDLFVEPNEKIKSLVPGHDLPLHNDSDKSLGQSLAVAKYAAKGTDLIPADSWDQAIIENVAYAFHDYWSKVVAYIQETNEGKKREMKKKLLEKTIDYYFSKFDQQLKEHGGFFVGKLTWVEFVLCGLVEASDLFFGIELAKRYPLVAAVVDIIRNLPGVKEHIATRGPYELLPNI